MKGQRFLLGVAAAAAIALPTTGAAVAAQPLKAPPGATAQCRDGSYSFSQHRRGTCSHHGGVRRWLRVVAP